MNTTTIGLDIAKSVFNPRISSNSSMRWGVDSADSIRARGLDTALQGRIYGCNLSCDRPMARKGLAQGGASIYGFFGTPRGLGLATATTSAAFLPHLEHRIRGASSLSVIDQPTNSDGRAQRALTYASCRTPGLGVLPITTTLAI